MEENTKIPCEHCYPEGSGLGSGICAMCRGEGYIVREREDGSIEYTTDERGEWIACTCANEHYNSPGKCTICGGLGYTDKKQDWQYWRDKQEKEQQTLER